MLCLSSVLYIEVLGVVLIEWFLGVYLVWGRILMMGMGFRFC